MAKRNELKRLEEEKGDLHNIIPILVNSGGQKLAAFTLGISQATISDWLAQNRYIKRVQYVRIEEGKSSE
jgi:hypothetical protein